MKKSTVPFYNIFFPIWMLWLFPITWIIILPVNFGIDLLVVWLTLSHLKLAGDQIKAVAKSTIVRIWLLGFVADLIGTVLMFGAVSLDTLFHDHALGSIPDFSRWWIQNIGNPVSTNPFATPYAFLWVSFSVFISGLAIFFFNYKFGLKKANLDSVQKKKLALSLAVFTAPYLFYFPTSLLYNLLR